MASETTTMHATNKKTTTVTTGRHQFTPSQTMALTTTIQTSTTGTYSTTAKTSKGIPYTDFQNRSTKIHNITPISASIESSSNGTAAQESSTWKQRTYSMDATMTAQKNLTVTPFDKGVFSTGRSHFDFS